VLNDDHRYRKVRGQRSEHRGQRVGPAGRRPIASTSTRVDDSPIPTAGTGRIAGWDRPSSGRGALTAGRIRVHSATIRGTSSRRTASIELVTLPTFAGLVT
jgi:hypothetical protein